MHCFILLQGDDENCDETMNDTDVFPPRKIMQGNNGKIYSVTISQATAIVVVAPIFPKNTQNKYLGGAAGEGIYVRQEPFAKKAFF